MRFTCRDPWSGSGWRTHGRAGLWGVRGAWRDAWKPQAKQQGEDMWPWACAPSGARPQGMCWGSGLCGLSQGPWPQLPHLGNGKMNAPPEAHSRASPAQAVRSVPAPGPKWGTGRGLGEGRREEHQGSSGSRERDKIQHAQRPSRGRMDAQAADIQLVADMTAGRA